MIEGVASRWCEAQSWMACAGPRAASGAGADFGLCTAEQCTAPSPVPSTTKGLWNDEESAAAWKRSSSSWRQRSVTPEGADDAEAASRTQQRSALCDEGSIPITPAVAQPQATASPSIAKLAAAAAAAAAGPAAGSSSSIPAAATPGACTSRSGTSALWTRIESFMCCVSGSALIQSALLSLELSGAYPAAAQGLPAASGMQWTLAQLLAMHLRAGYTQGREDVILASLWLLESAESVWRSPATVCLNDYLKHLAVFSQQAVLDLTADWKNSFRALRAAIVDAQLSLLENLDWRVQLDVVTEVKPCFEVLFKLPRIDKRRSAASCTLAPATPVRASPRELWAIRIHDMCSNIKHQTQLLRKPRKTGAGPSDVRAEVQAAAARTKRQRTAM